MVNIKPWILAVFCAAAGAAQAQQVSLSVDSTDKAITTRLERASLALASQEDGRTEAQDLLAAARADYRRMLMALYRLGHYGGRVSILVDGRELATIPALDAPRRIDQLEIRVDPGPEFTFGRAQITPLPAGTSLPTTFQTGQPAYSTAVREASDAAIAAWSQAGHAKAQIASDQIQAHHPSETLLVDIALAPGPQLRFGPLIVSGGDAVRPERIRQIAGLPGGAIYDPDEIEAAADRLRRTGTFRSVSMVEADDYSADLRLPIEAQIEDRAPRRIGAGLEYSTTEGVSATAYWLHRNLLGGAEKLRLDAKISGIAETQTPDLSFAALFERPATFGTRNTLTAELGVDRIDDPGYALQRVSATLGLARTISPELTASWALGAVDARVTDALGTRHFRQLTLPLRGTLDRRDEPRDATSGSYLDLQITPFVGLAGSPSGVRLYADGRTYRSFGDARPVTVAGRLQLGSLVGPSPANAPSDYLFYSGGGGTVRGQNYQALGIPAPSGPGQIGGASFLGASLEARVKVRGNWGAVGFVDYGAISADVIPGRNAQSHIGAGLGVRYDTRIGPIRFDVATPVGSSGGLRDLRYYIGIGQAF